MNHEDFERWAGRVNAEAAKVKALRDAARISTYAHTEREGRRR